MHIAHRGGVAASFTDVAQVPPVMKRHQASFHRRLLWETEVTLEGNKRSKIQEFEISTILFSPPFLLLLLLALVSFYPRVGPLCHFLFPHTATSLRPKECPEAILRRPDCLSSNAFHSKKEN